jgi:hypothetical protein
VANAFVPFNQQMAELAKTVPGRDDVPADVKASFDALEKARAAVAPKFAVPAGGRRGGAGGGRGGPPSVLTQVGQAKNGMMGGMWPTAQTMRSYESARKDTPSAIDEANALFTKATAVAAALAKYNLTLTAPAPVR